MDTVSEASTSPPEFLLEVTEEKRVIRAFALFGGIIAAAVLVSVTLALAAAIVPGLRSALDMSEAAETADRLLEDSRVMMVLSFILSLCAALSLWLATKIYRRRAASFLWPNRRPSVRQFGLGFITMTPLILILLFGYGRLEEQLLLFPILNGGYPLEHRIHYAFIAVCALFLAASAEEVLFRGLLLQTTASFARRAWAICFLNGLLFAAFHMYAHPVVFISLTISGALWAWVTLELGGIEFATGAHLANNLGVVLLAEPFTTGWDAAPTASATLLVFDIVTALAVAVTVKTIKAQNDKAARLPTSDRQAA